MTSHSKPHAPSPYSILRNSYYASNFQLLTSTIISYFCPQSMAEVSFSNTEIAFSGKSDTDLKRAHLLFTIMNNRHIVQLGKILLQFSMFLHLPVKFMIKSTIFKHFCGGETMAESEKRISELAQFNIMTILDYSVEGKESEKDFDRSFELICKTVENASRHEEIPFAVFKVTGMARFELLEKVNKGLDLSGAEKEELVRVKNRVEGICRKGFELNTPILIDAEESWIQDAIDRMVEENMQRFNSDKAIVFNTAQLYRHDRLAYLKKSVDDARQSGYKYGIKLVRGAYMEKERDRAAKYEYPSPINSTKEATDKHFDDAVRYCIENLDVVSVCCGSHNEKSSELLMNLLSEKGLPNAHPQIFFAQLLGMSDHISFNLSSAGYNVAKYVPFGPVYDVTPYLIRRTEENSSISGQSSRELSLIRKELKRRKQA